MTIEVAGYKLSGLTRLNVLLGKNGCGKSTLLKEVEGGLTTEGLKRYITPERAGTLSFDASIDQNIANDVNWIPNSRKTNQLVQFRQQSVAQFRRLEIAYLRSQEGKKVADFGPHMDRLNGLLDNIELRRHDPAFKIHAKHTGDELSPTIISSGEAELISLGIEALAFAESLDKAKDNYLFLDEPDVHLHPDLQGRLVEFLVQLVADFNFHLVIATHSTAILGALAEHSDTTVAFMQSRQRDLKFEKITDIHRRILPVFGAHPLSNVFNEAPVLILEGDDDERIWQQAVRTANGDLKLYPVACEGVTTLPNYEKEVKNILSSVYEKATGYSLRDRDGGSEGIPDDPPIVRMKLSCYSSENLLLSDEVLKSCSVDWAETKRRLAEWLDINKGRHQKYDAVKAFCDGGFDRKGANLKEIRNILSGVILNSPKSWEVLVGQALGKMKTADDKPAEHSLEGYLGEKTAQHLFG